MSEQSEQKYPSFLQQGKNLADFSFELIKRAINGESLMVSEKIQEERMVICRSCEFYDKSQNRCTECGCWLDQKTKFALDSCPIQKWSISNEDWVNGKYNELLQNLDKGCCGGDNL